MLGSSLQIGAQSPYKWVQNPDWNGKTVSNTFEAWRQILGEMSGGRKALWVPSTQVVSGSGSTTVVEERCDISTGTTTESSAGRYSYHGTMLDGSVTNISRPNWDKKSVFQFEIFIASFNAETKIRWQITQALTIGDLAALGLGVEIAGSTLKLASYGANAAQALLTAMTLTASTVYTIRIEHDPASAIRLYVSNVLKATQSTVGDIPSGSPAGYVTFFSILRTGGTDTTGRDAYVNNPWILQEI